MPARTEVKSKNAFPVNRRFSTNSSCIPTAVSVRCVPGAHIDGEKSVLACGGVVDVELRSDFEFEFDGFETGAAAKQIEAEAEILLEEGLLAPAEESEFAGIDGTGNRRHGNAAGFRGALAERR